VERGKVIGNGSGSKWEKSGRKVDKEVENENERGIERDVDAVSREVGSAVGGGGRKRKGRWTRNWEGRRYGCVIRYERGVGGSKKVMGEVRR
jgi:hypothetical protein